jgi:pimeloyl-ACP methyl ester carboxylesterase
MGTLERYKLTEAAREDYLLSYEGERFAESMRYVQTYPTDLPVLRDLLPTIQTPVQIIAGRRDKVVPLVNAEFLHERLPLSKLAIIREGTLPVGGRRRRARGARQRLVGRGLRGR